MDEEMLRKLSDPKQTVNWCFPLLAPSLQKWQGLLQRGTLIPPAT
jgi:hypothetical protein